MNRAYLNVGMPLLFIATVIITWSISITTSAQVTNTTSDQQSAYKARLQQELDQLEAEIKDQQQILNQKQTERVSLERDVAILNAQIAQGKLSIKARDIQIQQLNSDIQSKNVTIGGLNSQLGSELASLGGIMRKKDQLDTTSLAIAVLSSQDLSTFFSDLDIFDSINSAIQTSFNRIQGTKQLTQQQENTLQQNKDKQTQLLQAQKIQQNQVQQQENKKNNILAETKGQEKAYQALISQNQKSAAQIRAALFQLTGSAAIPFGKALDYANLASQKTGIRPAFLLGVIAEESNLGENVGKGTYTVDMSPSNIPIFKAITANLGLNPDAMPVSKRQWYGWGGAMGPAQFIPSTWALYAGYIRPDWHYDASQDRVGRVTGSHPPNPWDPKDAFMASALYLTDSGAGTKTPSSEFHAAMCYLAGCGNVNDPSLAFYGNSVAQLAAKYQQEINVINGG